MAESKETFEESQSQSEHRELPRSFDTPGCDNVVGWIRAPFCVKQGFLEQPETPECGSCEKEQARSEVSLGDKQSQPSEGVQPNQPSAAVYEGVVETSRRCFPQDAIDLKLPPLGCRMFRRSHASRVSSSDMELRNRRELLATDYVSLQGELRAKTRSLEERDTWIRSLQTEIVTLHRRYEEQSTALTLTRNELSSCQSQLDNVQRFISTADTHADQDMIQKLQELNEEVYQLSMTMADYVAENFSRHRTVDHQTKQRVPVAETVLGTVGQLMVDHLATVEGEEDISLFLQIAFQCHLSHVLRYLVSSWSNDQTLDAAIEGMYRRISKTETQAISGRWRSLTRANILLAAVNDPGHVVKFTLAGLLNIVMIAGLVSPRHDATSKFSSEFGEKILTFVSHAGTFRNMVSEMISGEFKVFVVHPGATFDQECMMDMDENGIAERETETAQSVVCISHVGLGKRVGDRVIVLTKAQVVLKSFFE